MFFRIGFQKLSEIPGSFAVRTLGQCSVYARIKGNPWTLIEKFNATKIPLGGADKNLDLNELKEVQNVFI